ncbi:hypothetical protein D3C86_2234480 [compost metagenome]
MVPFTEAGRIAAAHPGSRLLATTGLGHNRILTADAVLDAVLEHLRSPIAEAARLASIAEFSAATSVAA